MANAIDERDGKQVIRDRHWMDRVKKVKRYAMLKVRNKDTGEEKLVRRERFYKAGKAELGKCDKYLRGWEMISEHAAGADILTLRDDETGMDIPLDEHARRAYEARRLEEEKAAAELAAIRDEIREERRKMERVVKEQREREAKAEADKAEIRELLGTAKGVKAMKDGPAKRKRASTAKKKAAAEDPAPDPAPLPTPPATEVSEVQAPPSSPGGVRPM